ncbi:hypothetical protein FRC12_013462 [Ceratobasidium sp. 428]|nr:hypothetical protein FRC12_013462 [Ceratobasidium sp. 428]
MSPEPTPPGPVDTEHYKRIFADVRGAARYRLDAAAGICRIDFDHGTFPTRLGLRQVPAKGEDELPASGRAVHPAEHPLGSSERDPPVPGTVPLA